ncbi:MAG: TM1812 family CRISPR-associated protein [Bacteroidales bacterium]|nr:TM1812 family CRISPR-associated protein [Bacteroidales bacterium]
MARKVFISFLGTNNYVECCYSNDEHYPVRFIQETLIRETCKDWTTNDHIYIFCTTDAETRNWVDNGQDGTTDDIEKIGLESRLNGLKLSVPFEKIWIPEGFLEDDIWAIFDTVYKNLQKDDEIYFDVTHAFRSIPLFSTVLFNYSRFMIGTTVVSIKYGAFEKLGSAFEVKKKPLKERGVAPIVDLTNVIRLQQFTDMANSLKTFGRVNKISQMLNEQNSSFNPYLTKMSNAIESFDHHLLTNDLNAIKRGKDIIEIKNNIKQVRKSSIPNPIKNIIEELDKELNGFVKENSNKNIEEAIKWAVKYKMLAQAYTLGLEYIKHLFAEKFADNNPFNHKTASKNRKEFQEYFSALCSISQEDIDANNFKNALLEYKDLTIAFLNMDLVKELRLYYSKLGKNRNTINHAKGDVTYRDLVNEFEKPYSKCVELLK